MDRTADILLVEDNPTTSRTVTTFLRSAGYGVSCVASGCEGLEVARTGDHDLLVLDLMLPDMGGLELCRRLRGISDVPIVMLTARTTDEDIVEGLEAGADDYVCKPFSSRVLLARIRRCLERTRGGPPNPGVLESAELILDPAARSVILDGERIHLTRSEFDVLHALMRQPGRVFTRDQLIAAALGPDFDGSDRTIDTHVWSLRRKLAEPRGAPRFILSELGVGYRFRDGDED